MFMTRIKVLAGARDAKGIASRVFVVIFRIYRRGVYVYVGAFLGKDDARDVLR